MPDISNSPSTSVARRSPAQSAQRDPSAPAKVRARRLRASGAALVAAPMIFFLAEFTAAAAWTQPPYSYTYNYISNLGVRGPVEALNQYM